MKSNKVVILLLILTLSLVAVSTHHTTNSNHSEDIRMDKAYSTSYTPHDPIWIQSNQEFADQAAAESWAGDGSEETPYIITGYSFNQETQPLRIWDTTVHWRFINNRVDGVGDDIQCGTWIETVSNGAIINCEFLNRHSGMIIMDVENFTISGNYVHDTSLNGIEVMSMMTNSVIKDNIVEDINTHGILVAGMTSSEISGNEVSNCGRRGISVTSGFLNSELKSNIVSEVGSNGIFIQVATNSEMSFNTISVAEDFGMQLYGFDNCVLKNNTIDSIVGNGISIDYSEVSEISMNDIDNCTEIGIESLGGSNITILENAISDCDGYAVWLNDESEFFEIECNVFLNNGAGCQLYDAGDDNIFCYNYFSDWLAPDANSDGYVDLAYEIDGISESTDDWPITEIGNFPAVTTGTGTTGTTTTGTSTPLDLPTTLIIAGGVVGVIVLIAGILVLKRR